MDGISRIIDRIASDAADERAALAEESAARRSEIAARYAKEEKEAYGAAIEKGAIEAAARFERLKNVAQLEARKQLLAEKQALLAETFELAEKRLAELPENNYVELLAKLAADASRTGAEELIFSKTDGARLGAAVTDRANAILRQAGRSAGLTLSSAVRDIRGGLIASGGEVETNCTLSALVSQYKNELSPRVAEILF
ncbi:MAG: V-type ATP synthase subunit E [Oscillospiraceae bacterium]|jgi:V/A-type H+-transporting ATPase subunit E|nr:V-type ATP synthase subunit E [Oscillospiraceae bacterium]